MAARPWSWWRSESRQSRLEFSAWHLQSRPLRLETNPWRLKSRWMRPVVVASFVFLLGSSAAWSAEIFSKLPVEDAKQQALKQGKLLLLDFTASWCPPCKRMESTTWIDENVGEWVKANALAVQIDVDKDVKTATSLGVEAMPTLILFTPQSAGKEFGRQVGYQSPDDLLRWMKGAKSGKSAEEVSREVSSADDSVLWPRITKARELLMAKKYSEALDEYVWLWNNLSPNHKEFGEIRNKVLPIELRQMFAADPSTKARWKTLRDEADTPGKRSDWIVLNTMLGDNALTLEWFDKAKTDPVKREEILKLASNLEYPIFNAQRYADAADYLYPHPIEKIQEYHRVAEKMKHPGPDTEVSKDWDPLPPMVLMVYGSYVGAGRDAEAQKIAEECYRLDDSPLMHESLEKMAEGMKKARASHAASKSGHDAQGSAAHPSTATSTTKTTSTTKATSATKTPSTTKATSATKATSTTKTTSTSKLMQTSKATSATKASSPSTKTGK